VNPKEVYTLDIEQVKKYNLILQPPLLVFYIYAALAKLKSPCRQA
jgi:hypothetical protein